MTASTIGHVSGRQALARPKRSAAKDQFYVVGFNRRSHASVQCLHTLEARPFQGQVHCVSVPAGFFMIRHQGVISVTGNSFYGGTPTRMVQADPRIFPTRTVARWFQDLFFSTFPKVLKWQWRVCEQVEQLGYLLTPDGFRQHFSDVFAYTWTGTEWSKEMGLTAKEAIASGPQHTGMMYSAAAITALRREFAATHEGLRLSIHDSLLGEFPLGEIETHAQVMQQVMERPLPCMALPADWGMGTHLAIATEAKFSQAGPDGVHRWSSLQ